MYYRLRLTTILLLVLRLRLVRYPRAGLPHGVFGPGMPMGERPSPPPWGWSLGDMATPRT